jgi:hypothetical protein
VKDRDGTPVVPQSNLIYEEEEVSIVVKELGSKDSEVTWAKVEPRSSVISIP